MNKLFLVCAVSLLGLNQAEARYTFPTYWKVKNMTDKKIYLQCNAMRDTRLRFETPEGVAGGSLFNFRWSDWEYNDGLGLGADSWSCAAALEPFPFDSPNSHRFTHKTDWGQNVEFNVYASGSGIAVHVAEF
jgi:hypothetical protein